MEKNPKEYCEMLEGLIKKDFQLIKKMFNNIDPNKHTMTVETVPTMLAIKNNFLPIIIRNIEELYSYKAIEKVLTGEELIQFKKFFEQDENAENSSREFSTVKNFYV